MRMILTAAVSAFLLCGCMVDWPSKTSGPRFNWSTDQAAKDLAPSRP